MQKPFQIINKLRTAQDSFRIWPLLPTFLILSMLLVSACAARPSERFAAGRGDLEVIYTGFHDDQGSAVTYLFASPEGFPDRLEGALENRVLPIHRGVAKTTFRQLPYGRYAVGVLHDTDGDGVMRKDWLGSPLEGFALSGDPDYHFGRPSFRDASILLLEPQRSLTLKLRYQTGRQEQRLKVRQQIQPPVASPAE